MAKFHPDLDLMTEYSAGTLPLAQSACISVHIGYCEQCQRLAGQLSDIGAALVEELDEAHAPLDEAAGEEAVVGEARLAGLCAVHLVDPLWLGLDVHEFRDAGLHAEGHFILTDAGRDFGIADVIEL